MGNPLKAIQRELEELQYGEDAILDMINLLDKPIELSAGQNPDRRNNRCLNILIQTKEKELDELLEQGFSERERKRRFDNAKAHFQTDLYQC